MPNASTNPSPTNLPPSAFRLPPSKRPLIITIDGPAGVGKSTVAKLLAQRLGLVYLDTGATYRAVAYQSLQQGIDPRAATRVARLARHLPLTLRHSSAGQLRVRLNGTDVTRVIRTEAVTEAAAIVAQHPQVRRALVRLQRRLAKAAGVVVEGRDTGSYVFPRASYKFFLTARLSIRAARRQHELRSVQGRTIGIVRHFLASKDRAGSVGRRSLSRAVIARQLRARDRLDLRRNLGPLVKPRGAIAVDTSALSAPQVVSRLLRHLSGECRAKVKMS